MIFRSGTAEPVITFVYVRNVGEVYVFKAAELLPIAVGGADIDRLMEVQIREERGLNRPFESNDAPIYSNS